MLRSLVFVFAAAACLGIASAQTTPSTGYLPGTRTPDLYSQDNCSFPSVRVIDGYYSENLGLALNVGHLQRKYPGATLRFIAMSSNQCNITADAGCVNSIKTTSIRNMFTGAPYNGNNIVVNALNADDTVAYTFPSANHLIFAENPTDAEVAGSLIPGTNLSFFTGKFTTVDNVAFGVTAGTTVELLVFNANSLAPLGPSDAADITSLSDLAGKAYTAASSVLGNLTTNGCISSTGTVDCTTATNTGGPGVISWAFPINNASLKLGITYSGNGFRAMGAAAGMTKAISENNILNYASAISSVSGGSWFSNQFFFGNAAEFANGQTFSAGLIAAGNASDVSAWYTAYIETAGVQMDEQTCSDCWEDLVNAIYGSATGGQNAISSSRVTGLGGSADLLTCATMVTQALYSDGTTYNIYNGGAGTALNQLGSGGSTLMLPTYYTVGAGSSDPYGFTIAQYPNLTAAGLRVTTSGPNGYLDKALVLPPTATIRNIGAMSSAASGAGAVPATRNSAYSTVTFPELNYCYNFPCPNTSLAVTAQTASWAYPITETAVCTRSPTPPPDQTFQQTITFGGINASDFGAALTTVTKQAYAKTLGFFDGAGGSCPANTYCLGCYEPQMNISARRDASGVILGTVDGSQPALTTAATAGASALASNPSLLTTNMQSINAAAVPAGLTVSGVSQPIVDGGSPASSSSESCDATCVAAVILIPIMLIFFCVMAILSLTGFFGEDIPPPAKEAPPASTETEMKNDAFEEPPPAPLSADDEYKLCFELFAKGGEVCNTRDIAEALIAVGPPHDEDVDLEDENWNAEITFDEFAADEVPMEDRPVGHAAVTALIAYKQNQGAV